MFYDKYKALCLQNGETPFLVAKKLGISSRTQGNWKAGSNPRPLTLKKLADYFNVPVSIFDEQIETDDDKAELLMQGFMEEMNKINDDEALLLQIFRTMNEDQKNDLLKEAMRIKMR